MRYPDLNVKGKTLAVGRHVLYELETGRVILENLGVRHLYMANRNEYRLILQVGGREFVPRHSDFFIDFQLKLEALPDQRLAINDSCELVCNEGDPLEVMKKHNFPKYFSKEGEGTWSLQTTHYQTGGLPTEILLCGLQALILTYELNDPTTRAPEAFRKVFVDLSHGIPLHEAVQHLKPPVRPGKRYFDHLDRTPKSPA